MPAVEAPMAGSGRYPVPAGDCRVEETIKRSRFVTTVGRVSTTDEARAFVRRISEEFADATHNCWAFLVGPPGDSSRVGASDAGEPHGTAGRPMLNVLLHSGVGDVAAVVTRYYGGTKLGKGGLVRAYGGGVSAAMEALELTECVATVDVILGAEYALAEALRRVFPEYEVEVLGERFSEDVEWTLRLPEEHVETFEKAVAGVSNGRARLAAAGEEPDGDSP